MSVLRRSVVLFTVLCAAAAHAGLTLKTEMKRKGKASSVTMQFEGKNVRADMTKDGSAEPGGAFVSDGDNKKLVMIDFAKKEYHEVTQEQMKRMRAKMEAAMAQMKEKMAQLSPETRKQMEVAMGKMGGAYQSTVAPDAKWTRASGSKTVAGYKCELYSEAVDGKHVADACFIPWSELKGVDREQLKQSMESLKDVWSGFGMDMHMGQKTGPDAMLHSWGVEYGLPAWRKTVKEDPDEDSESTLTSISTAPVPRSAFEPPAGFTRKALHGMEE
jgi:hypothetical protein